MEVFVLQFSSLYVSFKLDHSLNHLGISDAITILKNFDVLRSAGSLSNYQTTSKTIKL